MFMLDVSFLYLRGVNPSYHHILGVFLMNQGLEMAHVFQSINYVVELDIGEKFKGFTVELEGFTHGNENLAIGENRA